LSALGAIRDLSREALLPLSNNQMPVLEVVI